uniref:Protein kinase domain-containing protein n=1 Tax=Moniliophthora roreri TaxID=221103 RepID=A0A0W0FVL6_MONRR
MPRALYDLPDFENCRLKNGDYHITEYLGSGGYGKVYKALDATSTPVAIKCLRKPKAHSREEEFLAREFSLHQKVSGHPNIVSIHEIIETDNYIFCVLDLCEGGDLHSAIENRIFYTGNDEVIRFVFVQLLDAVQYCHTHGVYHRDLKPENIMLSKDQMQIQLADFGLSTDQDVCFDGVCGSEYHMSPECIGSEKTFMPYHAAQNDVWALGIILFSLLTGLNPWHSASPSDPAYMKYVSGPTAYFRNSCPTLSDGVIRILGQVLSPNPLSRIGISALRLDITNLDTFFTVRNPLEGFEYVDAALSDKALLSQQRARENRIRKRDSTMEGCKTPPNCNCMTFDSDSGIHIAHDNKPLPHAELAKPYTFSLSVDESGWIFNSVSGDTELPIDPDASPLPLIPVDVGWSEEVEWTIF